MKNIFILFLATIFYGNLYAQVPAGYYDGTSGLTGEQLKNKLHTIIRNHTVMTYAEVKDALRTVDEDPNNSNNVLLIYSRKSIPKSDFASNNEPDFWNREHTWPKSHGFPSEQDTAYTDIHHLRPSDATINTSRSNKDFNNVEHIAANEEGEAPNTYTTSDFWEPTDEVKGDLARTMFYMATRYNSTSLDLELVDRISFSGDPELGVLYTLLQWNENDPVSQAEIDRNDGVYAYQGNRNPFIDNPTWVSAIWGTSTDPYLSLDQAAFSTDFGAVAAGNNLTQQYVLKGYNLTNDINVTVTAPFELSLDNTSWSQSLVIAKGSTSPLETTVYIRFAPITADGMSYEATVSHSTSGANTVGFNVTGSEGATPIISIADARAQPLNDVVYVTGVVISKGNNSGNSRVIFDGTAGIVVRSFDANNESAVLNYGDSITAKGGLSEYNNLLQIENSPIVISLIKENATVPAPQLITVDAIDESYESELVTVENVEFVQSGVFAGGGSAGNFTITDGVNNVILRIGSSTHPLVGTAIPSGKVTITGFVGQFGSDYQINPRDADDIVVIDDGGNEPITGLNDFSNKYAIYPNPTNNTIYVQGIESLKHFNVSITSLNGRKIQKGFEINSKYINVNGLANGLYLLHLNSKDEHLTLKIVKR